MTRLKTKPGCKKALRNAQRFSPCSRGSPIIDRGGSSYVKKKRKERKKGKRKNDKTRQRVLASARYTCDKWNKTSCATSHLDQFPRESSLEIFLFVNKISSRPPPLPPPPSPMTKNLSNPERASRDPFGKLIGR